jgi:hypothetical protein
LLVDQPEVTAVVGQAPPPLGAGDGALEAMEAVPSTLASTTATKQGKQTSSKVFSSYVEYILA